GALAGVLKGLCWIPAFAGMTPMRSRDGFGVIGRAMTAAAVCSSFPRKRESRGAWHMGRDWIPAYAGMTPCKAGKVLAAWSVHGHRSHLRHSRESRNPGGAWHMGRDW